MQPAAFSELLGYTSIACWLGAQFPQVLENIRRQSCEGLALPFLANWFLGDLTNLIGCILTHQLPFQKWLATYFVSVDFMLFSQYIYYSRRAHRRTASPPLLSPAHAHAHGHTRQHSHGEHARYRALSSAAAHVAVAAARAADEEEARSPRERKGSAAPRSHRRSLDAVPLGPAAHTRSATAPAHGHPRKDAEEEEDAAYEGEDEVDDDALAALADSFHSEGGRSRGRKNVSWSNERHHPPRAATAGSAPASAYSTVHAQPQPPPPGRTPRPSLFIPFPTTTLAPPSPSPADVAAALARGRPRERHVVASPVDAGGFALDVDDAGEADGVRSRTVSTMRDERERERRSSRASRRGAGLVFLGVGALVGLGRLSGTGAGMARGVGGVMRVPPPVWAGRVLGGADGGVGVREAAGEGVLLRFASEQGEGAPADAGQRLGARGAPEEPLWSERIVGRIFAWVCTTLYFTSRLPQIWKNFVRKSVEGLSMYLFVFAFLGNTFYVASILTSPNLDGPPEEAAAFLRESVPYLLGSGGTLCFDVAIVVQSFLYRRPARHHAHTRARSRSRARRRRSESYPYYAPLPQGPAQGAAPGYAHAGPGPGPEAYGARAERSASLSRSRSYAAEEEEGLLSGGLVSGSDAGARGRGRGLGRRREVGDVDVGGGCGER